jgi:excisionase family DNA binding protein
MDSRGKEVMTLAEVSDYLRIPVSTLYKLSREGTMPAQKLGKQWRYHKDAIDAWLAGVCLQDQAAKFKNHNKECEG